jgi:mevalonate kinase
MSEGAGSSRRAGNDAASGAFEAFGPGKIILLGEHAAVYGQPVLAGAISRGVTVRAVPSTALKLEPLPGLNAAQREALERAVKAAVRLSKAPPVAISVESNLPVSMGLGSSAALSVAVSKLLLTACGKSFGTKQVLALAAAMEGEFHGTPSGVDHTTSARAELILYRREGPTKAVKAKKRLHVVVALAGERTATKTTVAALRERREKWPRRYTRLFTEIGRLADEGAKAVARGDLEELGDLMNMNHGLLWAMQLSSERIDTMVRRMRSLGAFGAKLTGAGGDGGAVIGLFSDPFKAVNALTSEGVLCFESQL